MAKQDSYEVFAIRYASLANRKANENFVGGDPHEAASDLRQLALECGANVFHQRRFDIRAGPLIEQTRDGCGHPL